MEEDNFENDAQTVGEMLRNTRLKQGKTISEAAKELCIRKAYVEAIEKMEVQNLPPMPYALGFIRSYADFLGLNSDRIVSSYRKTVTGNKDENKNNETDFEPSVPKIWHILFGLVGLIILFAVWSFWPQIKQKMATVDGTSFSDTIPEPEIIDDTQSSAEGSAPEEDVAPAEPAETQENVDEVSDSVQNDEALATDEQSISQNKTENAVAEKLVKFKLIGPSWVELKQGDKVLLSGIYHKGFEYTVPSGNNVIVSIGRYYNAKFYIDGKETKVVSSLKHIDVKLDEFLKQD